MLKPDVLKQQLEDLFHSTIPTTFEQAYLLMVPEKTNIGTKKAKEFGKLMDEMLSEKWAETMAQAIDYYVKNAQIFGNLITNGSPTTHFCSINSTPMPSINGSIPNTLGIK
jgi:hypothetical protein